LRPCSDGACPPLRRRGRRGPRPLTPILGFLGGSSGCPGPPVDGPTRRPA
jgi:hypothetical protein